jgi:metal-responsive CopG/Arc/MetJ family transcriptional regulator
VTRRRIEPRPAVELETVSLRLPAELVRTVDDYAKYLGGSTDRTYVITQALELALERDPEFQQRRQARPLTAPAASARGAV